MLDDVKRSNFCIHTNNKMEVLENLARWKGASPKSPISLWLKVFASGQKAQTVQESLTLGTMGKTMEGFSQDLNAPTDSGEKILLDSIEAGVFFEAAGTVSSGTNVCGFDSLLKPL